MNLVSTLRSLVRDDGGAVLAEYAMILAVLSMASITALAVMGSVANNAMDTTTQTQLQYEQTPPG